MGRITANLESKQADTRKKPANAPAAAAHSAFAGIVGWPVQQSSRRVRSITRGGHQ
jgi:hypothetical protein